MVSFPLPPKGIGYHGEQKRKREEEESEGRRRRVLSSSEVTLESWLKALETREQEKILRYRIKPFS
jgi:hypothetical protein